MCFWVLRTKPECGLSCVSDRADTPASFLLLYVCNYSFPLELCWRLLKDQFTPRV